MTKPTAKPLFRKVSYRVTQQEYRDIEHIAKSLEISKSDFLTLQHQLQKPIHEKLNEIRSVLNSLLPNHLTFTSVYETKKELNGGQ